MQDVFQEAVSLLNKGDPFVVATVVRTKGSTPQKPGAKLLVRVDGTGVGTLGGGCVEGDIWFAAKELMKNLGPAKHQDYILNEDLAAQDGLVCGGTMYFLIDPVYDSDQYSPFASDIKAAYDGSAPVALATIVKPSTKMSSSIGDKLFIKENGETRGTLGSKETDDRALQRARELMVHGTNEYIFDEDGSEYFIEAYTTPPQIILCGAGHVSKAIAPIAKNLGFQVFVTDDREEFANNERFPDADRWVVSVPEEALSTLPINPNSFIVIATRGHRYDNVALIAAARTQARYVGLLGSKRKTILIYEDLVREGVSLERIKDIRSPIGLDIHARTPNEIALSIMSEILMFRLGGTGLPMKLDNKLVDSIHDKFLGTLAVTH